MNYSDLVKKNLHTQPVYVPGKPIEIVAMECGLDPQQISKLASNENPLGPSPRAVKAAQKALAEAHLYPENDCYYLRHKLAEKMQLKPEQLIFGQGSNEIIEMLGHAFIAPGTDVVMGESAFISYKIFTLLFGGKPVEVPLREHCHDLEAMADAITPETRLVFLPCPNNPTGTVNSEEEIYQLVRNLPDHVVFCLDQAYAEYSENAPDMRPLIEEGRKVIALRTFSKIYGLAGLRIGYGYAHVSLIDWLNRVRPPFNANSVAQAAALAALDDESFLQKSRMINEAGLIQLTQGLNELGYETVASRGNFIMAKMGQADDVFHFLQNHGVIVRPLQVYRLSEYLRITVGTPVQNEKLLNLMRQYGER